MARYTVDYTIRFHEAGPDGFASLPTLANLFQQTAGEHASTLGVSQAELAAHGLGWVMSRLTWEINRLPGHGETVRVETWPSSSGKGLFHRQYRLLDSDGICLLAASSTWAAFDIAARKLSAIPDDLVARIPFDDVSATGPRPRVLPKVSDARYTAPIVPRRSDLDLNGHVNNAQLVSWLIESLPEPNFSKLRLIDIQFRRECSLGDKIVSRSEKREAHWRHSLVRPTGDGETELARAVSAWHN